MNRWLWIAYILCAIIGGLASNLVNSKGMLTRPHWADKDKKAYSVGPVTDIIAGIAAAMGILWLMTPQTEFQLLGIGTIGGYGGSAILQALLNRLVADTAETEKGKIEVEKGVIEREKKVIEGEKEEVKKNMEKEHTQANLSDESLSRYMEYIKEKEWKIFKREKNLSEDLLSPWITPEEDMTPEQRASREKFEKEWEEWGTQVGEDETGEVHDVGFTPPQSKVKKNE